ncbi:cytochrome P450 [Aspergillus caelatus]|uniref:Cytochrome P450 n=1 Tax=Aspergillus caelatus TaxID=61420 RepID=A0A5N6ZTQ5_9EURO|nr:cytochrome P450 [Aspergillus caelatus]KAE8360994.1 cytochrome P450 [Aspergillus caelatus]
MTLRQAIETSFILLALWIAVGAIRHAIRPGQYVFKIQELHKQYGPIIRVTPDEIHMNDVGYLDTIYAPSMTRLDKYDYQLRTLRVPGGVGATADYYLHKIRREALTPFFNKRNVLLLDGVITEKVKQLCDLIAKHATTETPINLSDAFYGFSNDVVNNFLFAHETDVLADEQEAARLRHNSHELLKGINMNKHFPWIHDILEALPQSLTRPVMPPGLIDMLELFDKKPANPGAKESVYESVLDNPNLPASEKALQRLEQEGALLTLAGTESPAQTLNIIFYHLLANPSLLTKLRNELDTLPSPSTWAQLEKLPYLSTLIEEGNRLSFGVTARAARIQHQPITYTPSAYVTTQGPTHRSHILPPGTPVSITMLSAHTAESVFPDPYVFNPGRWLGDEGRERRNVLGIELARAELYLVTAALVRMFDLELWETGERDVSFEHDYHVTMPKHGSRGVRIVAKLR